MAAPQTIRVNFKTYDVEQLKKATDDIVSIVRRSGAQIAGPIPMPTRLRKFCVLRSPHVDKKSREQFEIRIHKRILYIKNSNPQTMDSLMKMEVSPGVEIDIKVK